MWTFLLILAQNCHAARHSRPIFSSRLEPQPTPVCCCGRAACALSATGFISLLLPFYLTLLGFGALEVGLIITATLLGSGLMTLAVGMIAHRHSNAACCWRLPC